MKKDGELENEHNFEMVMLNFDRSPNDVKLAAILKKPSSLAESDVGLLTRIILTNSVNMIFPVFTFFEYDKVGKVSFKNPQAM